MGTERHHGRFLDQIDRVEQIGCFGLTELGYGNNAVEMETTATYDPSTQESVREGSEGSGGWARDGPLRPRIAVGAAAEPSRQDAAS